MMIYLFFKYSLYFFYIVLVVLFLIFFHIINKKIDKLFQEIEWIKQKYSADINKLNTGSFSTQKGVYFSYLENKIEKLFEIKVIPKLVSIIDEKIDNFDKKIEILKSEVYEINKNKDETISPKNVLNPPEDVDTVYGLGDITKDVVYFWNNLKIKDDEKAEKIMHHLKQKGINCSYINRGVVTDIKLPEMGYIIRLISLGERYSTPAVMEYLSNNFELEGNGDYIGKIKSPALLKINGDLIKKGKLILE